MYDLLARWRMGELDAEIPLVISNHSDHADVAEHFDVAFHTLPVTAETRIEQESAILSLLAEHDIELVVLARYMQILSRGIRRRSTRAASSTSTTRSCRRSPADVRTTRRTTEA